MSVSRRLFYWHLPLAASAIAAIVFAWGFWLGVTDRGGEAVLEVDERPVVAASPSPGSIVILGDSVARGVGDESGRGLEGWIGDELAKRGTTGVETANLAVSGARTADLMEKLERPNVRRLLAGAGVVIISIGGNDLNLFMRGEQLTELPDPGGVISDVAGRVESIVASVREASPESRIFLVGLYNPFLTTEAGPLLDPWVHRWNAKLIERFANDPATSVVMTSDIFSHTDRLAADRFHPGSSGYERIARRIVDAL